MLLKLGCWMVYCALGVWIVSLQSELSRADASLESNRLPALPPRASQAATLHQATDLLHQRRPACSEKRLLPVQIKHRWLPRCSIDLSLQFAQSLILSPRIASCSPIPFSPITACPRHLGGNQTKPSHNAINATPHSPSFVASIIAESVFWSFVRIAPNNDVRSVHRVMNWSDAVIRVRHN